jgi:hypothetical protein
MNNIKFEAMLTRSPIKLRSNNWQETSFHWVVAINGQSFDYYTGCGLINEDFSPKEVSLDDVLYSLISDSEALNMNFNDWRDNFGYENTSEAKKIYKACIRNAKKLIKTGIDIDAHRERLQDH